MPFSIAGHMGHGSIRLRFGELRSVPRWKPNAAETGAGKSPQWRAMTIYVLYYLFNTHEMYFQLPVQRASCISQENSPGVFLHALNTQAHRQVA